jgi:formate dehydrogenase subunit delta
MDIHRLIKMANDIGAFFDAEADRSKAAKGVADHLKSFWEKRMRRQILSYFHEQQGAGLSPLVLEALRRHEQELGK